MTDSRQHWFTVLGDTGCYVFSLVRLAEEYTQTYIDAYRAFRSGVAEGQIREDCFVLQPAEFLGVLTARKWSMTKEAADYQCKLGELEILRFERQETGKTIGHFVTGDENGGVDYDPEGSSVTVAKGALVSKRIFR